MQENHAKGLVGEILHVKVGQSIGFQTKAQQVFIASEQVDVKGHQLIEDIANQAVTPIDDRQALPF